MMSSSPPSQPDAAQNPAQSQPSGDQKKAAQ